MGKGQRFPSESQISYDARTGARVRQVTHAPAIHLHPYYYTSAYDDGMRRLAFSSTRFGAAQIFVEDRESGDLIQLTDRDDLAGGSLLPSRDGNYIYFSTSGAGWRVNTTTCAEERLVSAAEVAQRLHAPVAPVGGATGLSGDDEWLALALGAGEESNLVVLNTRSGDWDVILRGPIGHCQFCPDDPTVIWYGRSLQDRIWALNRDGTNNRRLYARRPDEWVTHEAWLHGAREVIFAVWPQGLRAVHVDTGAVRTVTTFNAWHASSNRAGALMVSDTAFPDIGLQLFDPRDGVGRPTPLCYPEASCLGDHWKGPFPYSNGPIPIYAPPQTHPHPSFSPDGRYVVYTSDKTQRVTESQIYEVELP
jgi:oligogalacturonide lyase